MPRFSMASVTAKSIKCKAMGSFWRGHLQDLTSGAVPGKACSPDVYNTRGFSRNVVHNQHEQISSILQTLDPKADRLLFKD